VPPSAAQARKDEDMTRTTRTPATARLAWDLARDQTIRLPHGRHAALVRVERGTVLVTQEGDREDHVLEPGDDLVLDAHGVAVAWAFTDAVISLRALDGVATATRGALRLARDRAGTAIG
jgi:Protein of unknown function (DUF2917)